MLVEAKESAATGRCRLTGSSQLGTLDFLDLPLYLLTHMPAQNVRFGRFQLDLKTGELFQNGSKVPLQEQPFQILKMLLERPGEVVSRDEIREDTLVRRHDRGVRKQRSRSHQKASCDVG